MPVRTALAAAASLCLRERLWTEAAEPAGKAGGQTWEQPMESGSVLAPTLRTGRHCGRWEQHGAERLEQPALQAVLEDVPVHLTVTWRPRSHLGWPIPCRWARVAPQVFSFSSSHPCHPAGGSRGTQPYGACLQLGVSREGLRRRPSGSGSLCCAWGVSSCI